MKSKKKLKRRKWSIYKGGAGSGTVFVVIVVLMMVAVAFTFIGGKMPQMDNRKIGSQVVLVTSAPQAAKNYLQLYTFIGLSITPSPTPTPDPNPIPLPQITNVLSPVCPPGGKPAIGNIQIRAYAMPPATGQNQAPLTWDTFGDTTSLDTYYQTRKSKSAGEQNVYESFGLDSWSWDPTSIRNRFALAHSKVSEADYFVFLLEEELVQPSASAWYTGWRSNLVGKPGYSSSYGPQTFEGVTVNYGATSEDFYLQLLTAWHQLCVNTQRKCAFLVDMGSPPSDYASYFFGANSVNYIAANYDMIYLYSYPSTVSEATCGGGFHCAAEKIKYWRDRGFKGKIQWINSFSSDDNVFRADFKNAADAGADIISVYPSNPGIPWGQYGDVARLINTWNAYSPPPGTPTCTP